MASLSPSPHILINLSIPLFLLLFTACQAVPINQLVNAVQNPDIDPSDRSSHTIRPPTPTFSLETHSSLPLLARDSAREPASVKFFDSHQGSVMKQIRPFASALQSEATNQPKLRPIEKLSTVDYLSPPLRGTETRDRYALHISSPEQKEIRNIQESSVGYQQKKEGLVSDFNVLHQESGKNATDPNSSDSSQSSVRSLKDQDRLHHHQNTESVSPWTKSSRIRDDSTEMSTTSKYYSKPFAKYHRQNPSPTPASSLEETRLPRETENRSKRPIEMAKNVLRRSAKFGRMMYERVKSAVEGLVFGSKASSVPVVQEKRADGYSEEDVITLVHDIIREIQMRSSDMGDHAKMLEKTDRWDPNDITTREHKVRMGSSPLLYMRTKVLVTPEALVDAVMTSTEKLFSSKANQLPRKDMSKLLKEVQIRLVHVLKPAI